MPAARTPKHPDGTRESVSRDDAFRALLRDWLTPTEIARAARAARRTSVREASRKLLVTTIAWLEDLRAGAKAERAPIDVVIALLDLDPARAEEREACLEKRVRTRGFRLKAHSRAAASLAATILSGKGVEAGSLRFFRGLVAEIGKADPARQKRARGERPARDAKRTVEPSALRRLGLLHD